jgi:hypothetical protein
MRRRDKLPDLLNLVAAGPTEENKRTLQGHLVKYFDRKYMDELKTKSNLVAIIGTVPLMKYQRCYNFPKPKFDHFYAPAPI